MTLRLEIDGEWTEDEFSDLLRCIAEIYGLRAVLAIEQRSLHEIDQYLSGNVPEYRIPALPMQLKRIYLAHGMPFSLRLIDPNDPSRALRILEPNEQLYLSHIQFASHGHVDLVGSGEVLCHVKKFLEKIIGLHVGTQRWLEEVVSEADVRTKQIDANRVLLLLAKDLWCTDAEIRQFGAWLDDRLARLSPIIQQGKILQVRLDEKQETKG